MRKSVFGRIVGGTASLAGGSDQPFDVVTPQQAPPPGQPRLAGACAWVAVWGCACMRTPRPAPSAAVGCKKIAWHGRSVGLAKLVAPETMR